MAFERVVKTGWSLGQALFEPKVVAVVEVEVANVVSGAFAASRGISTRVSLVSVVWTVDTTGVGVVAPQTLSRRKHRDAAPSSFFMR